MNNFDLTSYHLTNYQQAYTYNSYPVISHRGELSYSNLDRLIKVIDAALTNHPRSFGFRIDLQLPINDPFIEERLIERFTASFKAKVKHSRIQAKKNNPKAHNTAVRYAWAREASTRERVHYHFVFMLNKDAYNTLGSYELGRDNLFNKLVEAWASALDMPLEEARGLIHIPDNSNYWLDVQDQESINRFLYRASYLAKVEAKTTGRQHSFGCSRL